MASKYIDAAKDGNVDILRDATRKDLNTPDEDGMTATIWAARNGNLEALRLIVGREGEVNKCDFLGLTPLHHAAMLGHLDVVSFLVNWGCNVYCLDNDKHSAQDLASIHDYHEIIRFLDKTMDKKRYKNPKSVTRQKEEAIRAAEINQKRYEKLQDAAAKKAEKEQKRIEKDAAASSSQPKKNNNNNIFKAITLRMKGHNNKHFPKPSTGGKSNFSDMAGLSYPRNATGVAKKLKMRTTSDNISVKASADFKVSVRDEEGNRTFKSIGKSQGLHGTVSEVMYVNASKRTTEDDLVIGRKPLASDMFSPPKSNIYRPKSESDLLDSGVDSYYGEDDDGEDISSGIFNHTEFGKLSLFLSKNSMNTLQSFPDHKLSQDELDKDLVETDGQHNIGGSQSLNFSKERESTTTPPPWSFDDVDELDENDESGITVNNKLASLETFLAVNGLTHHLHVFSQEEIDLPLLMEMTDSELKDLGLPFGTRKKLADAIKIRKAVLETPCEMFDTHL